MITASYIIRIIGKVFFGPISEEFDHHIGDVTVKDKVVLTLLCVIMITIGVFPSIMSNLVSSGVNNILSLFTARTLSLATKRRRIVLFPRARLSPARDRPILARRPVRRRSRSTPA